MLILGLEGYFLIYYELYNVFIFSLKLGILFIITIYSIYLLLNHFLSGKFYFFSNFNEDYLLICHEYTY